MIINQSFVTNTSFAISAGAVVELAEAPAVTLKTTSVIGPGRLDVKDNKVIITSQPLGTWNASTSSYGGVTGMIASAYNFSAWTGNGLTTSMPAASVDGITTLAVSTAEAVFLDQFGGVSVAPSNVLVMYTYAGDTNLDGLVDAADYGTIDNWVQFPGTTGYANGDFNFDGVIDAADYGIIDNTIQLQGAPFPVNLPPSAAAAAPAVPAGASALSGVTAVPEPSACGLAIFAAAAALLPRRRRQ
jgi:hypothetical protein